MSIVQTPAPAEVRTGVPYDEYLRLRDDPAYAGRRMAYHDGVLEIMAPKEYRHEKGWSRLGHFVLAYCAAFGLEAEAACSTTFSKGTPGERRGDGGEPDESFYLGDVAVALAARESEALDLEVDGPPSLWIEVDNTSSSVDREDVYAGLGVPEVWRYRVRDRSLAFRRLAGGRYEDAPVSAALPGLTPALVLAALAEGRAMTTGRYIAWLREVWFPAHRDAIAGG